MRGELHKQLNLVVRINPYLQEEFDLDESSAREILTYWMKTFEQ